MSHPENNNAARPESGRAGRAKTLLISLVILLVGLLLIWLIFKTQPTASRQHTARKTAMLVDVEAASAGRFRPTISVMGKVVPAQEVALRPRVSGHIQQQADVFEPGNTVAAGQTLVRLDPADYQTAVAQRRSELQQAKADLALEEGRQSVAQQEFDLLGQDMASGNKALVLREPQRQQAQAQVAAARAGLKKAQLDLERTDVTAPFDAQILSREVTAGSQVSVGDTLARLVATDRYWVEANVPLSKLHWLSFDTDQENPGAPVTLHHDAWPAGQQRQGQLHRLVGELDDNSRLARVIISVADPLALNAPDTTPRLILGAYMSAAIQGRPLDNTVRLKRDWVRRNDTVWVMEDDQLSIRDVDIAFADNRYAYLNSGVAEGEWVITSDLVSVVEGAKLRREEDGS